MPPYDLLDTSPISWVLCRNSFPNTYLVPSSSYILIVVWSQELASEAKKHVIVVGEKGHDAPRACLLSLMKDGDFCMQFCDQWRI
jgi:hypothetical protein